MLANSGLKELKTKSGPGGKVVSFPRRGGSAGQGRGRERERSDLDQRILEIRRVTRVVRGGRRFSFSLLLAAGDCRGRVGLGIGKAVNVPLAIDKAFRQAKKNLISVPMTSRQSIPHEVEVKFNSARLWLAPNRGRGLIAGSVVRSILDLAGLRDVSAKILSRSKNKLNNARATMAALQGFRPENVDQPNLQPGDKK